MIRVEANAVIESDVRSVVETTLHTVRNIATLPIVAARIMELTKDPDSTVEDIENVIAGDPALAIRIMKIVNSSFYALPRQIDSIRRAVLLLGRNAVKNIAIATSVHKVFQPKGIGPDFDARDLWLHSIAVATGARQIALMAGLASSDEAFLAGLIHDVGIMVEMQACRHGFAEVVEILSKEQNLTFRQAEQYVLGATHESFGAGLCRKWKLPVNLERVAGYHHRPMELPEADRRLTMIVHVADVLAAQIRVGYTRTVEIEAVDPDVLNSLCLEEAGIESLVETLPDAIQEAQLLLS